MFPINPSFVFSQHTQILSDVSEVDQTLKITYLVPYLVTVVALDMLGLPLQIVQRILFGALLVFPGVSMYVFTRVLSQENESSSKVGCFISALFYMLNPYVAAIWSGGNQFLLFGYGALPLVLAIVTRAVQNPAQWRRYSVMTSVASLSFVTTASFPAMYLIIWGVVLAYFLMCVYILRVPFRAMVRFLASSLFLIVAVNLWWVIPLFAFVNTNFPGGPPLYTLSQVPAMSKIEFEMSLNSAYTSVLNVMRLFGNWPWFVEEYGYFYTRHYGNPFLLAVSLLPAILMALTLLMNSRNRTVLMFTGFLVLSVFLAKGVQPPLSTLNRVLYLKVPYGWLFLNNFQLFVSIIVLSYSVHIAFFIPNLLRKFRSKRLTMYGTYVLATAICLLFLMNSFPLLYGQEILPTYVLPPYYDEFSAWAGAQEGDFKFILFPETQFYESYRWGYFGPGIMQYFAQQPVLTGTPIPYEHTIVRIIHDTVQRNETGSLARLLELTNVKYVLIDYDLGNELQDYITQLELVFAKATHLKQVNKFGSIAVYENELFLPRIYARSRAYLTNSHINELPELLRVVPNDTAIFFANQLSLEQMQLVNRVTNETSTAKISFESLSSTSYVVKVRASSPFFLILSQPFLPSWKAYVNGVELRTHLVCNGFANAWYVEEFGEFEVQIEYAPQRILETSITIAIGTFAMGCFVLTISNCRTVQCLLAIRKRMHNQLKQRLGSRVFLQK